MEAVAGLGNPGRRYASTRHNVGRMLLERLKSEGRLVEARSKERVDLERIRLGPDTIWMIRPRTYMNDSGTAVAQACRSLQLQPDVLLIAYDDIDLPLGRLRLRRSGSSGGHRGLESVLQALGTARVPRLRLGIRGQSRGPDTAGYVLDPFEEDEREIVATMIGRAAAAIRMILRRGLRPAMNEFNRKPNDTDRGADTDGAASNRDERSNRS